MKTIVTISFLVASLCGFSQTNPKNNIAKVNLFSTIVRTGNVAFEHRISESSSIQLGAYYSGFSSGDFRLRGFGITPEFRYYATNKGAMEGFYLAPFLRYQHFTLTEKSNMGTLNTFGGGLVIGNQWIFGKGITLDVFAGPSYNKGNIRVTSGVNDFDIPVGINGFGLRAGTTIGFAF